MPILVLPASIQSHLRRFYEFNLAVVVMTLLTAAATKAEPWPGRVVLPGFPKNNPRKTFSELKVYGSDGSSVRTPAEDWAGARKRMRSDPAWAAWVEQHRVEMDEWMEKRRDHSNWITGWGHDFVSPKDGTTLTFTPDEPGLETLSSPSDPKVKLTEKLHAAWVCRFRYKHSDMMLEAARLYRLTGDRRYAEWAAGQLDFYADHLGDWKVHKDPPCRIFWQSLDEAVALGKWVNTARLLGDYVTLERKKSWSEKLFLPEARMLEQGFQLIHNIACWHRSAAGQVALYCNDEDLWKSAVDGPNGIRNQVARGITSDYLWYEQSLSYNRFVIRALMPFFRYALWKGRGKSLVSVMETAGNLPLAPLYMLFPNGQLPSPADGWAPVVYPSLETQGRSWAASPEPGKDSPPLVEESYIFPTKIGLKLQEILGFKSWDALLDPLPGVADAQFPEVTSRNMESSRMAIIKRGPWQIFLHYGQLAMSHAEPEALNFEAFYNDVDITHDPGTGGYGAALTNDYFRTAVGHNVPLADGRGQTAGDYGVTVWHPGKLVSFGSTSVSAAQPKYAEGVSASRTLEIERDRLIDIAGIETNDGKTHALGFVLNLQGRTVVSADFKPVPDFVKTHPAKGFQAWTDVRSTHGRDRAALDVRYGGLTLRLEFLLSGDFTIYHATVPDYPPKHREAIYVETTGRKASLKTTFSPVHELQPELRNQ